MGVVVGAQRDAARGGVFPGVAFMRDDGPAEDGSPTQSGAPTNPDREGRARVEVRADASPSEFGLIEGDWLRIDPPGLRGETSALFVLGVVLAVAVGAAFAPLLIWVALLLLCVALVAIAVNRVSYRRDLHRLIAATPDDVASQAGLAWHTGPRRWGRRGFDTAGWLKLSGPHGPRVLFVNTAPACVPLPDDIHEEADIAARRPLATAEKHHLMVVIGVFSLIAALQMGIPLLLGRPLPMGSPLLTTILFAGVPLTALYWFGLLPFAVSAAVCSPGRVECAGLGGSGTYTRADSVLVVAGGYAGWLHATLHRADGRCRTFTFKGDLTNPGLQQLLARWCHPAYAARRAAPSAVRVGG